MNAHHYKLRRQFLQAMGLGALSVGLAVGCTDKKASGTDSAQQPAEPIDPLTVDNDGDGFSANDGDCDDANPDINPEAQEVANDGIDQDCDGEDLIDRDGDGFDIDEDCLDDDPTVYPGASEIPNDGIDQDCDGADLVDLDEDGFSTETDCDDANPLIHPDASEICDGQDNDCDGLIDDDDDDTLMDSKSLWFADNDGDGYGAELSGYLACMPHPGDVDSAGDCNDADPTQNPAADELADGIDNDCNGLIDDLSCDPAFQMSTADQLFGSVMSGNHGPYEICGIMPVNGVCLDSTAIDAWGHLNAALGSPTDPWCEWFPWGDVCGPTDTSTTECCYTFNVDINCIAVGRPLRVDGDARLATLTERSDWGNSIGVSGDILTAEQRSVIVDGWLKAAREEHASIASFARFTMELMALGAPADLIMKATAAQADEIAHAQACFGIAGNLSGVAYGPGPLDISGIFDNRVTVEKVLIDTIFEACVNETLAAAEAAWLSERCVDKNMKGVLRTIAADESRHAALGWKTLRWLIARNPELISSAISAFDKAKTLIVQAHYERRDDAWLAEWGLMPSEAGARLRHDVWANVIGPCMTALLNAKSSSEKALVKAAG